MMLTTCPKAIFLDLDDTITSFDLHSAQAWRESCSEFIQKYEPKFLIEELLDAINKTRKWYWQDSERNKRGRENLLMSRREVVYYALKKYAGEDYFSDKAQDNLKEQHSNELADSYSKLQNEKICLLPGSLEAIQSLRKLNIRLAVITNGVSSIQREKLQRFGLTDYFEHIFIDTEVGYSKPDKRIFEYALDVMMLSAKEVWMVGDNINWDIRGPQQLGIFSVWDNTRKIVLPEDYDVKPELCINSLTELVEAVNNIKKASI